MQYPTSSGSEEETQIPGNSPERAVREPSRSDIAQAITARLQSHNEDTKTSEESKRQSDHKIKIRRLINELTASINYEKASNCLRLIHTLIDNILKHPTEEKYRSFKVSQPSIARDILALDEGRALLVEIGWRTRTNNFQQEWFIPAEWNTESLGMKKLKWSLELIAAKTEEFEENAERVKMNKEREKLFESNRKSRALDEAREDRERVALRAERERIARKATEARAKAEEEEQKRREAVSEEAE